MKMTTKSVLNAYKAHLLAQGKSSRTVGTYVSEAALLLQLPRPHDEHALGQHLERGRDGQPIAAAHRNLRLYALRSFMRFQIARGVLERDPTSALRASEVGPSDRDALSIEQLRAIAAAAGELGTGWRRTRNLTLIELFFQSGLRVSELASLNCGQVDWSGAHLRAVPRKGGRIVDVPLNAPCVDALQWWREAHPDWSGPLFGSGRGRLSVRQIQRIVRESALFAGVQARVSPHVLRHSHAQALLAEGVALPLIQQSLGHRRLSTTERYLHPTAGMVRDALSVLPQVGPERRRQAVRSPLPTIPQDSALDLGPNVA